MRTHGQRWQDMTARLCEMLCEAESQHAQADNTGGAGGVNGQSEVRGQYSIISIVELTFDSPQIVLKGCPKRRYYHGLHPPTRFLQAPGPLQDRIGCRVSGGLHKPGGRGGVFMAVLVVHHVQTGRHTTSLQRRGSSTRSTATTTATLLLPSALCCGIMN